MAAAAEYHNDHNVYILGAGFSALRGVPVVRDFMSRMREAPEVLRSQGRDQEADAVGAVLRFRQEAMAAAYRVELDLDNIEQLFSLASARDASGRARLSQDVRVAIAATIDLSQQSLLPQLGAAFAEQEQPMPWTCLPLRRSEGVYPGHTLAMGSPYALLIASLLGQPSPSKRNTFISLNYDTVVEEAAAELGLSIDYGAAGGLPSPDGVVRRSLRLLKLHGSINWSKSRGRTGIAVWPSYRALRDDGEQPLVIPPTWAKVGTSGIQRVWSSAMDELKTATRIIILGFSFPDTDQHLRYLIATGLEKNISLREVHYLDLRPEEVQRRAERLLGGQFHRSLRVSLGGQKNGVFEAAIPDGSGPELGVPTPSFCRGLGEAHKGFVTKPDRQGGPLMDW